MSNQKEILEKLEALSQQVFLNESKIYTAESLVPRFKEAANKNRYDLTINQAAFVIEKLAQSNPACEVRPSDLKELGSQFYTSNTNYGEEFADLLEEEEQVKKAQVNDRIDYQESHRSLEWDGAHEQEQVEIYSDKVQSNLIDDSISYTEKEFDTIKQAAQLIDDELMNTRKVKKVSSILKMKTSKQLVFQTKIKIGSNEISVIVPVEINEEVPLFPQVMATTENVYTLDVEGIEQLVADAHSSTEYKKAQQISSIRSQDEYDMEVRNDSMDKYEHVVDELEVPDQKMATLGLKEIEDVLEKSIMTSDSKYTPETIQSGGDLVSMELKDAGFNNPQVKFSGDYNKGLTYKVSMYTENGKVEIVVPVEVSRGVLLPPSEFKVAGSDETLIITKQAINQSTMKNDKVEVHPYLYSMSYPELKKQLKTAAHNKQFKVAKQIITLIGEKFDNHYQNAAITDYQTWLEESSKSYQSRCGKCDHYSEKTAIVQNDYCSLLKTATKNVQKDSETEICTRSTYANLDEAKVMLDNGQSIKISWED